MKTRDIYVGRQRIQEFEIRIRADGSSDMVTIIDDWWRSFDMSFDEAVMRATNGESIAPCWI